MADYPATLPAPDHDSYAGVTGFGIIRTEVDAPLPNQVKGFNSPRVDLTLTFHMDNDTWLIWRQWVDDNGYDWFNMALVTPKVPVAITSTQRVRFTSAIQMRKEGDNWVSVAIAAELWPGAPEDPLAPLPELNLDKIIAGTPPSPSIDRLIGGTPDNPSSPDRVISELYAY